MKTSSDSKKHETKVRKCIEGHDLEYENELTLPSCYEGQIQILCAACYKTLDPGKGFYHCKSCETAHHSKCSKKFRER
jgi:hypothetical protein